MSSSRPPKLSPPHLQPLPVRPIGLVVRENNLMVVELLKPVPQHRTIMLLQNVVPDFDDIVGSDADDVTIESGVVDLAERQAVRNHRLPAGLAVRNDVRRVEKLGVLQVADGTVVAIGVEYHHAKRLLMKPGPASGMARSPKRLAKMESHPASTVSFCIPEEAISGVSSAT